MIRLFTILLLFTTSAYAYDMPIGIPDPSTDWGVNQDPINDSPPARPDPWDDNTAGYYYIDYDDVGCSDAINGYPGTPRCKIPNPVGPGAYVEVHGTYDNLTGGDVRINAAGDSGAWVANTSGAVWVVGIEGSEPTFTGGKTFLYGDYLYLYNVDIVGVADQNVSQMGTTADGYAADYIVIRDCDITGIDDSDYGLAIAGRSGVGNDHFIAYNNTIHDVGPSTDNDTDSHLISILRYTEYIWILNNTMYNAGGSGLQVGPFAPAPQYIYAGDNHIYNVRQSGMWVKHGTDVIFSENLVHDINARCVGVGTSLSKTFGYQYNPTRVWYIYNEAYNAQFLFRGDSTDDDTYGSIYIIGNVFHDSGSLGETCSTDPVDGDPWSAAAISLIEGATRAVVGNTIYNVQSGINIQEASGTATNTFIENNIISTVTHANGNFIYDYDGGAAINSNVFYSTANEAIRVGAVEYSTVSAWESATSNSDDNIEDNPDFVSTSDLSLINVSPAKDAGYAPTSLTIDVYDLFFQTYGLSIEVDINNKSRPYNAIWDMGAYEYRRTGSTATFNATVR